MALKTHMLTNMAITLCNGTLLYSKKPNNLDPIDWRIDFAILNGTDDSDLSQFSNNVTLAFRFFR